MKFMKKLAFALAFVMLLSCGLSVAASAASVPTATALSEIDRLIIRDIINGRVIKLANGNYLIQLSANITNQYGGLTYVTLTPDEYKQYLDYAKNQGDLELPQSPDITIIPGIPCLPPVPGYPNYPGINGSYTVFSIEMDQYTTKQLSYGSAYSYSSSNSSIVSVDASGKLTARAPGEVNVFVSYRGTVRYIYEITVNEVVPNYDDYEIKVYISKNLIEIGESINVYAYLAKDGKPAVTPFPVSFNISVGNSDILALNGTTITGIDSGVDEVTVTIPGTDLSTSVNIYVKAEETTNKPIIPEIPPYYPIYPGGSIIIGGSLIGGIDTSKYDVAYKIVYLNGRWQTILVLVEKEAAETPDTEDKTEETEPVQPGLTPEEIEKMKQEAEEAERLAQLKNNIDKAFAGELEWYEVYSDMSADSYYVKAADWALNNKLVAGKDDGTFGSTDKVTNGDVKALLCAYLDITADELKELGILAKADDAKLITRQEIAHVFYQLATKLKLVNNKKIDLSEYADSEFIKDDYKAEFSWAIANKILNKTSTSLTPNANVDRARLVYMLYKFNQMKK